MSNERKKSWYFCTDSHYKMKFAWYKYCVYCGQMANTVDHVLPVTFAYSLNLNSPGVRKELGQGLNKVPCCSECNTLASNAAFVSILEKRRYVQKKLRGKYKRLLVFKPWDEDELVEVSSNLRDTIVQSMHKRMLVESRVNYPFLGPPR